MGKKVRPVAYLTAAALLVVCCGGKVYGIQPFGTPMFCALSGEFFIGFTAPIYLLCEFLFTFELWRLYTAAAVIFIMAARWVFGLRFFSFNGRVAKTLSSVLSVVVHTVLSAVFSPVVDAVIGGFVGGLFYYFALNAAKAAKTECRARLNIIEGAALCAVFFVAGLSFARASYGDFLIGLAPAFFCICLLGAVGVKSLLVCSCALAVGFGMNASPFVAPAIIACALCVAAFSSFPRVVYVLTAIGMFCAVAILFYADAVWVGWSALMLAAGGLPFCIVPRRAVRALGEYFDFDGSAQLAVRHYINRIKSDAGNRMLAVASVFDETARLMTVLTPPPPDYAAVGEALRDRVCPYCPSFTTCYQAKATAAFTELAEKSSAGRAILTDLPEFFTAECVRAADVVSASAVVTDGARERARELECEQKAKSIVTERLKAVKDVLEELGKTQAVPVGFDGAAEKKIAAELSNNGVECAEVFCTRDGVTALVRTATASRDKLVRAVDVCLKRKHEIRSIEKTQAAGWSVAELKRCPRYDAVYARAGIGKDKISGDSYTFKRIGDKFLVALLDGMGSGSAAGESSGAAVELIECFYRAGFDSESVITGVNRFLKLPTSENYSAADVVVLDLDSANADIIKLGSPSCYIKTADTVLKISGGALPIGVLDEMRPYVTTKKLYPGQMLILVTDGISDCFEGDELPEFINGLSAFNPERAANAIVERALKLSGGKPRDDMTAVAVRLFDKKK